MFSAQKCLLRGGVKEFLVRAAGPRGTFPNGGSCGPGPSNCWHLPCAAKGNPGTEAFFKASRHTRRFESAAPNWRCLRAGGTGEGGAATHRCSSKSSRPCDWPQPGSGLVFVGGGTLQDSDTLETGLCESAAGTGSRCYGGQHVPWSGLRLQSESWGWGSAQPETWGSRWCDS